MTQPVIGWAFSLQEVVAEVWRERSGDASKLQIGEKGQTCADEVRWYERGERAKERLEEWKLMVGVSQEEVVTAAHNRCWREIMGGITKHGSAKRSIEILERDEEQTLKTLWREEKLDEFFPRQELVEEMHKLHEEHREAKRKAREDSDMGDAGETAEEEKEFSQEEAIWARKLDGAAIDKENKILYVLEFKRTVGH